MTDAPARSAPTVPPDRSDEALVRLVASGDRSAFAELVERHRYRAMRLAYTITRNRSAAEDVVQDAFLRVWTHIRDWDEQGGAKFAAWFTRVTINLAIDMTRKRREQPMDEKMDFAAGGTASDEAVHAGEIAGRIGRALAGLPERQRTAFALCQIEHMSNADAAASLGVTVGALELLLVRARRAMRQELADVIEALR